MVITIERAGEAPSPQSIDLVAGARSFANRTGLAIYAGCVIGASDDLEAWVPVLGQAGCDRIVAVSSKNPTADIGKDFRSIIAALRPLIIISSASQGLWKSHSEAISKVGSIGELELRPRPTSEQPIVWVAPAALQSRKTRTSTDSGTADVEIIFLPGRGREVSSSSVAREYSKA